METKRSWILGNGLLKARHLLAAMMLFLIPSCGDRNYETRTPQDESGSADASAWPDPTWPRTVPEGVIDFRKHVRPILIINCLECHNEKDAPRNGNFVLVTREKAMTTGSAPPAIVPGDPDKSPLLTVMTLDPLHQRAMPPTPDKIWGVRLEILRRWIREGAVWPDEVRLVHPGEVKEW